MTERQIPKSYWDDEFQAKFVAAMGSIPPRRKRVEQDIDQMVNRFLSWKLPKDFCPDAGISFKPTKPYEGDELGNSWWPIGTNLLTAVQAREMIKHIIGVPG